MMNACCQCQRPDRNSACAFNYRAIVQLPHRPVGPYYLQPLLLHRLMLLLPPALLSKSQKQQKLLLTRIKKRRDRKGWVWPKRIALEKPVYEAHLPQAKESHWTWNQAEWWTQWEPAGCIQILDQGECLLQSQVLEMGQFLIIIPGPRH